MNVFPYFCSSCFKGYGNDPKGFYTVYDEVFKKLAAEESEYMTEDDPEIPQFGKSDSNYEDVVAPFYSYWMAYSTKKSYSWLDPFDTREAPNRKVGKLIEKENKKVRDKAKKERNDEIRNLVKFVRKRDKRVEAWSKVLEEKAKENLKKSEEHRRKKIMERKSELENYTESEWSKFSNVEKDLKHIEESIAKEFGDEASYEDGSDDEDDVNSFFCVACNKVFKTEKAFANHEKSKRHKDNVELIKQTMMEENKVLNLTSDEERTLSAKESEDEVVAEKSEPVKAKKLGKQKKTQKVIQYSDNDSDEFDISCLDKHRRKGRRKNHSDDEVSKNRTKKKDVPDVVKEVSPVLEVQENLKELKINSDENESESNAKQICATCKADFLSKNKLFAHLKKTGHSVYLPTENKKGPAEIGKNKKGKKGKK